MERARRVRALLDTGGGHAFLYDFVVTRTNLPSLGTPVRLSSTQLQFLLSGMAGQTYTVQAITNLNSNNWSVVLTTNAVERDLFSPINARKRVGCGGDKVERN